MLLTEAAEVGKRISEKTRTVIVGSGAVGLYTAHELAKRGQDVLVIECGGVGLDGFPQASYSSIGNPHEGIRLARNRGIGGTTNLWGGQLVEFQPIDFEGRDWLADSKWPVSYSAIAPFYRRTYENLGISSDCQDDSRIFRQVLGTEPQPTEGIEVFLTRWLKVPSFALFYSAAILSSPKLLVLINHTVVGLTGSNGLIEAVRVVDRLGKTVWIKGDQFIIAAGTIESCRLLLHAATSDDWNCPWRNNDNVGAYFQDHLVGRVASVHPQERRRFFNAFSTIMWRGNKFQPKLRLENRTLEQFKNLNVQGMFSFESSVAENLVYLKQFVKAAIYSRKVKGFGDLARNLSACRRHLLPLMWSYVVKNRIFVPSASKISLLIQTEQPPIRESRIRIDSSVTDIAGMPKVVLDWKVGNEVLGSISDFAFRCDRALRATRMANLEMVEGLQKLDQGLVGTFRDNYHQTGGARMGFSERDGVVDSDLRVFGTSNLYVAGASTFRTTSNANVTFTALAFATRLIDRLTSGSITS